MQQQDNHEYPFLYQRSEERFSRNAETDLVCRLLLEKKKRTRRCARRATANLCTVRGAITTTFPSLFFFFFNDTATTEIYTLSLHDALPISDNHEYPFLYQ